MLSFEKRGSRRPYIAEFWLQARWFGYYISLSTGLTSIISTKSLASNFICDVCIPFERVCANCMPAKHSS